MVMIRKKHLFMHIGVIIIVLMLAFLLALLPLEADGRTLVIIEHNNSAQRYQQSHSLSQESRNINLDRRRTDRAQREVDRAQRDVANAYLPRGQFQQSSRYYDIQRAESDLYDAQNNLRAVDNDVYFDKRLRESDERDAKLANQIKEAKRHNKPIINEPPYQVRHEDDDDD